jgi:hypothetical protein
MKKNLFTKLFLSLILLTTNACDMNSNESWAESMKISVHKNRTVKFENFKNIKHLEKYLNEKYPTGSDANKMIEDMKSSLAQVIMPGESNWRGTFEVIDQDLIVFYLRNKEVGVMHEYDWIIHLFMMPDRKVKSIIVTREYFGV